MPSWLTLAIRWYQPKLARRALGREPRHRSHRAPLDICQRELAEHSEQSQDLRKGWFHDSPKDLPLTISP